MDRRFGRFVWDEAKRRRNLHTHGIDFRDVAAAFDGPGFDDFDVENSAVEDRWRRLMALGQRVAVVIYTERGERPRLISARYATRDEAELYWQYWFGEPDDRN